MVLFDQNRNVESEAAFNSALTAPGLDADLECRARFHRAQSAWKQRQRPRAAPLFDEAEAACARAANRDLHAKALYQGARCYASAGNRDVAMAHYTRLETEHADHSYADDARLRSAELATDAGDEPAATKLLSEIPTRYPKGDLLNEALWRLAFSSWRAGRDDDALHWLDENLRLVPHEEVWYAEGRVQYWKGRVFEKQGKIDDARAWYERAVREYPLSVYALLSLKRMKAVNPGAEKALIAVLRKGLHDVPAWTFPARPLYGDAGFLRAVELARMGQGGDARRELGKLGLATSAEKHSTAAARGEEEDLVWITATLLDRGGVWSASHSLPRHAITNYKLEYPKGLGEAKWKLAYPRAFPALVAKNTKANQLPEALQLAIMREESAFSPRIESFANAIGLTQMLVKTAKRFANGATVTRELLLDPRRTSRSGRASSASSGSTSTRPRRWRSPATTRVRGRSTAGWASAAISRWTSSWRRSRTTRRATTRSACSPRTSRTHGCTASSRFPTLPLARPWQGRRPQEVGRWRRRGETEPRGSRDRLASLVRDRGAGRVHPLLPDQVREKLDQRGHAGRDRGAGRRRRVAAEAGVEAASVRAHEIEVRTVGDAAVAVSGNRRHRQRRLYVGMGDRGLDVADVDLRSVAARGHRRITRLLAGVLPEEIPHVMERVRRRQRRRVGHRDQPAAIADRVRRRESAHPAGAARAGRSAAAARADRSRRACRPGHSAAPPTTAVAVARHRAATHGHQHHERAQRREAQTAHAIA